MRQSHALCLQQHDLPKSCRVQDRLGPLRPDVCGGVTNREADGRPLGQLRALAFVRSLRLVHAVT